MAMVRMISLHDASYLWYCRQLGNGGLVQWNGYTIKTTSLKLDHLAFGCTMAPVSHGRRFSDVVATLKGEQYSVRF